MDIVLLHDEGALDGRLDEQDAMVQVGFLGETLRAMGHATSTLAFGLDTSAAIGALQSRRPGLVFNLVESVGGHGRLIHLAPAILDTLGVPYTGASTEAMFLTSHKVWTKRLLVAAGLPTPAWVDQAGGVGGSPVFPGRYIVKSVWEDASLGLGDHSVVDVASLAELHALITDRAGSLGGEAFAEAWVEGREFNVSVLEESGGPRVLPLAEMCFVDYPADKPRLVSYTAKWIEDSFEYNHTVRSFDLPAADADLATALTSISKQCWDSLALSGYARVDFRVDAHGTPFVLEVNANPCLSPDAGFAAAAERAGLTDRAFVSTILDAATRRAAPAASPASGS